MSIERTIMDYPDVDDFFRDVMKGYKEKKSRGFGARRISDEHDGQGREVKYTVESGTSYGAGVTLGVSNVLFGISISAPTPFDEWSVNTRGEESSTVSEYQEIGLSVSFLFLRLKLFLFKSDF